MATAAAVKDIKDGPSLSTRSHKPNAPSLMLSYDDPSDIKKRLYRSRAAAERKTVKTRKRRREMFDDDYESERREACLTLSPTPSDEALSEESEETAPYIISKRPSQFDRLPSPVSHTDSLIGEQEEEIEVEKMTQLMKEQARFSRHACDMKSQSSQTGEAYVTQHQVLSPPSSLRFEASPEPNDYETDEEKLEESPDDMDSSVALNKQTDEECQLNKQLENEEQLASLLASHLRAQRQNALSLRKSPQKSALRIDTSLPKRPHFPIKPTAMIMLLLNESNAHRSVLSESALVEKENKEGEIPLSPWVSEKSEMETLAEKSSIPSLPSLTTSSALSKNHLTDGLRERAAMMLKDEKPNFSEEELEWAQLRLLSNELTLRLQSKQAALQQWQRDKRKQKQSPYVHYVMSNQ